MAVETYIVSVYRRGNEPGQEAAGLVERTGGGERRAFTTSQELWTFLCSQPVIAKSDRARKRCTREQT